MQAIKFLYVDILKSKVLVKVLFILIFIQFWMMKFTDSPLNTVYYMFFVAVITSTQPFIQEQTAEVGFINMLPGTIKMRVIGRYLYALSTVLMCMIICSLNLGIYALVSKELPPFVFEGTIFGASIALLFSSIQYIIFYALGKLKSQQLAGLIMMIPGFVMFFGVSFLASWMKENTVVVLEWLIDNHSLVVLLLTLCSVLSLLFGIILSTMIVNKKDSI